MAIDQIRITQVIRNILDNAIKYSKPDKNINIFLDKNKNKLIITIKDQGIGIKKQNLSKIFQKFKQMHSNAFDHSGGSGLGLFIARKIIELHKGEIKVESKLNKGSTFIISLPIKPINDE